MQTLHVLKSTIVRKTKQELKLGKVFDKLPRPNSLINIVTYCPSLSKVNYYQHFILD